MSRRDLYTCDACGDEDSKKMSDVSVQVQFGSKWLLHRRIASAAGNLHVCERCADGYAMRVEDALNRVVPASVRVGSGW